MKLVTALSILSLGVLSACDQDPEVTQRELAAPSNDLADIAPEAVTADPPAGTSAGLDLNNDRNIDKAEWTGMHDDGFLAWNNDEDQQRLSKAEFMAGWTARGLPQPEKAFMIFDDDNDGFLTNAEFFNDSQFAKLDKDRSGVLDDAEWEY